MTDWQDQLLIYQSNIIPAFLEKFAAQLHVSTEVLQALEIGYALKIPLDDGKEFTDCWVFPERDEHGQIIGLLLRRWDGKKRMVPGSKRGLIYVPNVHQAPGRGYQAGPQNWERTSKEICCPICGKPDWCMVSAENPTDPQAVLCCRVADGAERDLGTAGYLHIRKPEGYLGKAGAVLRPADPVLIVEGASDVAAALMLNLTAIGRPNNTGCLDKLPPLIAGREVVVMGENDAGAGREGMEKTYEILRPSAKRIIKLMPLEGIKDLRDWVIQGLTRKQFLQVTQIKGDSTSTDLILSSIAPLDLAKQWLKALYYNEGIFTLRALHGAWYAYSGKRYREVEKTELRKQLYQYLGDKQYKKITKNGFALVNYEPTKYKVDQIIDALLAYCPVNAEQIPCWLSNEYRGKPNHILRFPNGLLNIADHTDGQTKLINPTAHFFSLSCYPYDFNPTATCELWHKFLGELFDDDPRKILMLQEWFGYNLIPDNSQEKFMLFIGPTRAGKSTILDVLTYILGETQVIATSFRDCTRRFGLYPFVGKLAAVIGDVSVGANFDAVEALNLLKRITGNDPVMIERKGRDITQTCIRLYTRFTMAANTMPRLPDYARTIEARMLTLQFTKSFMGREDTTLKDRLKAEAPGILVWALEGLERLRQYHDFTLPASHHYVTQQLQNEMTPLTQFVEDCCELDARYSEPTDRLFEVWRQWAIQNGEKPNGIRWMGRVLLALYPTCRTCRMTINGRRKRAIRGFRLTNQALIDYLGAI